MVAFFFIGVHIGKKKMLTAEQEAAFIAIEQLLSCQYWYSYLVCTFMIIPNSKNTINEPECFGACRHSFCKYDRFTACIVFT